MTDALSFIIEPLHAILRAIHSVIADVPYAWGFSIIILTMLIRIVLIPLTVKQYTSMRAMQRLQPEIKKLQAKYKDDRQKMNEELMKFYRENKVNPFGSCLPLLLQMPVFLALFYMLRNEPFTPDPSFFWIKDISELRVDIPLVLLFMGTQFISSKMMSASVDKSQQIMLMALPLIIGVTFLFWEFPAGVLIYWVTTNVWSVGQQLVVMKIINAREADEPAPELVDNKTKAKSKAKPASKTGGKHDGKSGKKGKSSQK
ncbi:MAG: YidC/Oxa1 family membrane protein insertase [Thermoleophilia bacterium]